MTHEMPSPDTIERLGTAVYPSFALLAGMQLDVFTPLKDGPLNADQIAEAIGVGSAKLRPLLYSLVAIGLLAVNDGQFSNTPEADHFLVRQRGTYIGVRHHAFLRRWRSMLQVAETIRTGSPQGKLDYGSMSKAELESFYWGTYTEARAAGRELLMRQDFSRYQRLVDVGTGSGGLAVAFAEAHPHLHITAVDLPTTTPITERYVSEAGVADRVKVLPADVVIARLPGSYDVAILRGLLIVLPPDQAQRVLVNVGPAIAPGGAIYVMGNILDDSRDSPAELASYNLHFVNSLEDGQLYTEGEITGWLADAGFGDVMHEPATRAVGSGFLMGRRPA